MIKSFGDKETERCFFADKSRTVPSTIRKVSRRKLQMIDNATVLDDLRVPLAIRLEKLKGDLSGFYSIRINDQWRVVFKWSRGSAREVRIVDYH